MTYRFVVLIAFCLPTLVARAHSQVPAPDTLRPTAADSLRPGALSDSLRLGTLQDSAVMRDPRGRELALLAEQSRLRQQNLAAERRPALSIEGQAQYQSDVARIPITLPGGISPPTSPHDTYDAHLAAGQTLYDPGIGPRRAVEDAQLAASQARLRAELYPLRQNVADAFFATLQAQSQIAELELAITDLEAQHQVAAARVREGAELWRSLEETGVFTSLAIEMIKVGEATGALEEMLTNTSDFYDEAIEAQLQRIVTLIEPIILVVMGGVVATLLLSIYLPMFTILSNIRA